MKKNDSKTIVYLIGLVSTLVLAVILFSVLLNFMLPDVRPLIRPNQPMHGEFDFAIIKEALEFREISQFLNMILTTVNALLLIYLLYNYLSIYLQVKSKFSLGLIVIASALFAHSISANPVISQLFGFRGSALVLVYLSRQ
jgi:hypothetical protein